MWYIMEKTQENYHLSDRLIRAISRWQLDDMEDDIDTLIERGADVNRCHGTLLPLHCACMAGDVKAIKLLLRKGARVNELDGFERTALHYAAERDDDECLKILLESGAHINAGDGNDDTALHWAAYKNQVQCVRLLLLWGAKVNVLDYNHDTPLTWAARKGNFEVIRMLLDYNADVDIRNLTGHTALQRSALVQGSGLNTETDDATLELLIRASGRFDLLDEQGEMFRVIANDNRLSEFMRPLCQSPRCLVQLCRHAVRKAMPQCYLPNVISSLPVPHRLQEYLLLRDKSDFLERLTTHNT